MDISIYLPSQESQGPLWHAWNIHFVENQTTSSCGAGPYGCRLSSLWTRFLGFGLSGVRFSRAALGCSHPDRRQLRPRLGDMVLSPQPKAWKC